ncbi:MAG: hypothetical protein KDC26_03950 [Armatimonadetes bacterium]|nr:hypothetical protein [Armatimonadota bacterium]
MKWILGDNEIELEVTDSVTVEPGKDRLLVRTPEGMKTALAVKKGDTVHVSYAGQTYVLNKFVRGRSKVGGAASGEARAPMPGQIVEVSASVGDSVEMGEKLLVLEAMKMQQSISVGISGKVKSIDVAVGDQVAEGQLLALVEPEGDA